MKLAFIHRESRTAKMIMEETGIPRWGRGCRAEVIINYGVAGGRFEEWRSLNPLGWSKLMLNRPIGLNKFQVIKKAQDVDITCPETRQYLDGRHNRDGWLSKPWHSSGGRDITLASEASTQYGKYFQQYITDRLYELRVHAFVWIPQDKWVVQKRVPGEGNEGSITWNHHTGGTFITVNDTNASVFNKAVENSAKVLEVLGMQFGGVDFIVDSNRYVYFIEINSAVGCSGLSDGIYVDAFERLKELDREEVLNYVSI